MSFAPFVWTPLTVTLLWTSCLFVLTFLIVGRHYETDLPHFDSMGGYSSAWHLMNTVASEGYLVGLASAVTISTGWLQPFYALVHAALPFRSPEALISLNFVCLLLSQVAVLNYAKAVGFSGERQIVMAVLPVVPGVVSAWHGGIQDFRRDSQLVLLMTGALFQSLAFSDRPGPRNGVFLGVLGGLTLWSRDNSAFSLAIAMGPAIALTIWRGYCTSGVVGIVRRSWIPTATFLLLTVPYYALTLTATWNRYTTNVWGFGNDSLASLVSAWDAPFQVMIGMRYAQTTVGGGLTTLLIGGISLAIIARYHRLGRIQLCFARVLEPPYRTLIIVGAVVAVGMVLFYAVVAGISAARYAISYLPVTAPTVMMLAGSFGAVLRSRTMPRSTAVALTATICALVLALVVIRMDLNAVPPIGEDDVASVKELSLTLGRLASGRPLAFLWTADFSRHHADYYLTQAGYPKIVDFALVSTLQGQRIDLDQPLRPGDRPEELQGRLDHAIRTHAHFVVVNLEVEEYEASETTRLWPYLIGRPVVERLLADASFPVVGQFTVGGRQFVLLENLAASPR